MFDPINAWVAAHIGPVLLYWAMGGATLSLVNRAVPDSAAALKAVLGMLSSLSPAAVGDFLVHLGTLLKSGAGGSSSGGPSSGSPVGPAGPVARPIDPKASTLSALLSQHGDHVRDWLRRAARSGALALALAASVALADTGCGWWSSNSKSVVNDLGQIASCVVSQLFQGATDPLAIAGSCAGSTLADVEQVLASVIAYYDQPDAGAADRHCGAGAPPYPNLPTCIAHESLLRIQTLRVAAKAQRAR